MALLASLILLVLLAISTGSCSVSEDGHGEGHPRASSFRRRTDRTVLSLLNIEPIRYASDGINRFEDGIWDRGLDVIPAGHLAIEQINNRSDLLAGYELQLIDVDSEACGLSVISEGVANVVKELVKPDRQDCIVGIVGLLCSAVTKAISPIVSHPNIGGYVQLSSSTSPVHSIDSNRSDLFRIVASSSVFNEATLSLMEAYGWKRISIVHTSLGLFSESVANDFVGRIQSLPTVSNLELVSRVSISDFLLEFNKTFNTLRDNDARISYWSVSYSQSSRLLCEAYHRNSSWPGYVYILREPTLSNILEKQATSCTKDQLLSALEGAFLLQYRLYVENDTMLYSGVNFREYKELYNNKLEEFANSMNVDSLSETDYANSLYDQVWAFAIALNKSLPSIASQNLSFSDYRVGHIRSGAPFITNILKRELKSVSFQGASGKIKFNENHESPTFVDIYQVQNGTPQIIGVYDPIMRRIFFTSKDPRNNISQDLPSDSFKTVYEPLPLWISGCILAAQVLLFCLTTANLLLILRWRKAREIKATSLLLNVLMIIGCYILCVGPFLLTVIYSVENVEDSRNTKLIRAFCILKNFASVGFELILATLFFRLLRIYQIFRSKQMTMMSNYWLDRYLFIYILAVCAGKLIVLVLWNSVNPVTPLIKLTYIQEPLKLPFYVATMYCTDEKSMAWLAATLLYTGVLLLFVLILAIMTRHVKNDVYKDTKKVNIFIFLVVICVAITLPLLIFFTDVNMQTGAIVAEWLFYLSVPVLCQLCLFVPKTLPLLLKRMTHQRLIN